MITVKDKQSQTLVKALKTDCFQELLTVGENAEDHLI